MHVEFTSYFDIQLYVFYWDCVLVERLHYSIFPETLCAGEGINANLCNHHSQLLPMSFGPEHLKGRT